MRLHLAYFAQVESGHGLDAVVRLLARLQPLSLEPVDWPSLGQGSCQEQECPSMPPETVDDEERCLRAAGPERNERLPARHRLSGEQLRDLFQQRRFTRLIASLAGRREARGGISLGSSSLECDDALCLIHQAGRDEHGGQGQVHGK